MWLRISFLVINHTEPQAYYGNVAFPKIMYKENASKEILSCKSDSVAVELPPNKN